MYDYNTSYTLRDNIGAGSRAASFAAKTMVYAGYALVCFIFARLDILGHLYPFGIGVACAAMFLGAPMPLVMAGVIAGVISSHTANFVYNIWQPAAVFIVWMIKPAWDKSINRAVIVSAIAGLSPGALVMMGLIPGNWTQIITPFASAGCTYSILTLTAGRSFSLSRMTYSQRIAASLLCAIFLSGLYDWHVFGVSVGGALMASAILFSGFALGAGAGAGTGVACGLIMLLEGYDTSLLVIFPVAGAIAGVFADYWRNVMSAAYLASCISINLALWFFQATPLPVMEALAGCVIFMLVPRKIMDNLKARLNPDDVFSSGEIARHVARDQSASIKSMKRVFEEIADTISNISPEDTLQDDGIQPLRVCVNCPQRILCYRDENSMGYNAIRDIRRCAHEGITDGILSAQFQKLCPNSDAVLMQSVIELCDESWEERSRRQYGDMRAIVGAHMRSAAWIAENTAKNLNENVAIDSQKARELTMRLRSAGYEVRDAFVKVTGSRISAVVRIGFCHDIDACLKEIAREASKTAKMPMRVEEYKRLQTDWEISLQPATVFRLAVGVATQLAHGQSVNGDSHSFGEAPGDHYMLAICDGMGSGRAAHMSSSETIELLGQCLKMGASCDVAMETVNGVQCVCKGGDVYASADWCVIDCATGNAHISKMMACPTLIKRGGEILVHSGDSLPIGAVIDARPAMEEIQLQPDDVIIMFSDGITQDLQQNGNWLLSLISRDNGLNPQWLADKIIAEASARALSQDDRTVVVARMMAMLRPQPRQNQRAQRHAAAGH